MMQNILIFSERDFSKAPRIIREMEALKGSFQLFLAGINPTEKLENYSCIYSFLSIPNKIENQISTFFNVTPQKRFSKIKKHIIQCNIDIVIIHEPQFLPLFSKLKEKLGFKLIFNAHEYHPLEFEDQPGWIDRQGKIYYQLYKNYLKSTDLLINVSEGIMDKCLFEFAKESIVIPNATSYRNLEVIQNVDLPIKLIHHGANLPSRKIEQMIEIANILGDNYQLDLMLTQVTGCEKYDNFIDSLIKQTTNVKWKNQVSTEEISAEINNYDIGLFYLEPTNFNYKHALPNKLFEFIQARLAIAISPSVEMVKIIDKYGNGVYSEKFDPKELAEKIKSLTRADINKFKFNSNGASKKENAEFYNQVYLKSVLTLINAN